MSREELEIGGTEVTEAARKGLDGGRIALVGRERESHARWKVEFCER